MIDIWEALGRLAYDRDLFCEFQVVLGPSKPQYLPAETVTVDRVTATVLDISKDAYIGVQRFLRPILTEQFVPLFVAGELIWTFSRQDTRDAFARLQEPISKLKLHCPSTSYFIALGLFLVDNLFRAEVANCGENLIHLLPRLSEPQRRQLATLVKDPVFLKNVQDFEDPWDEGCFDRAIWYTGYAHPVAVDPTKQTVQAEAVRY